MASVRLNNVGKIYENNVRAVSDVSIDIEDKEFIVLVGPSGCGKSTLLRMIAGLEDISEGTISINDKVVNQVHPKDRDIAMVFQNYALYPHMTVFENMAFSLKLRKFPKDEIEKRVGEAAELLDLAPYLQRKPKALSGGQRQRVAVGRAIVRQPAVFLFDEPLSNLDAKLRVQMRIELTRLHQRLGTTMIYVTHDQVEAMTMGDRIVVLNNGQMQQYDTPLNLYNYPKNKFVAGFIGSPAMNFFEGNLVRNGQLKFSNADLSVNLGGQRFSGISPEGDKIILGIRPEHLVPGPTPAEGSFIESVVQVVEPMGNETFIHCQTGASNFTVRTTKAETFRIGQKLQLLLNSDSVQLFNPADGTNLTLV